jgi:plastocyanin
MPSTLLPPSSKALSRRTALAAIAGAALAGCSGSRTVTVELRNMAYGPAPSDLKVGDAIHWLNRDIFEHTATARDGSFDVDMKPGGEARTVLNKAGMLEVYCRFHPGMKLTLGVAA